MLLLFEGVAVTLWLQKATCFIYSTSATGSCLSVGLALFTAGKRYARQFVQLAVGLYMLVYLGLMSQENMQIEGFLVLSVFRRVRGGDDSLRRRKIFGPLLFGRGWCGYACWTAMVLDLLPFKVPQSPAKKAGHAALCDVRALVRARLHPVPDEVFEPRAHHVLAVPHRQHFYYAGGIALAFIFKDNRAFCKYLLPNHCLLKADELFFRSCAYIAMKAMSNAANA